MSGRLRSLPAHCNSCISKVIDATHCFLSKQITQLVNLHLKMSARLEINLVDEEQWACLGVAHKVHVAFSPEIV